MKKIIMMVAVAMMAATNVKAQEGYDDTKHEVAVSCGAFSNSQWIDVLENMTTVIVGATYDDEKFFGPISAEYFYHAKSWLGVGGIFVFGRGIGIEAGSPAYIICPHCKRRLNISHMRCFVEFGVGEQGLALAGIRYKF